MAHIKRDVTISTNSIVWNAVETGFSGTLRGLIFANNSFVAVGDSGVALTSTDGLSWVESNTGASSYLNGVAYGNGLFVAVGSQGNVVTSSDGLSWTIRDAGTDKILGDVHFADNSFVAVGGGGGSTILTSSDGIIWVPGTPSGTGFLNGITYGNNRFVIVGYGGGSNGNIQTSTDGVTWAPQTSEISGALYKIAYGNNTFVIVGYSGTLFQSNALEASINNFAASVSNSSVTLSWDQVEGATGYLLYYGLSAGEVDGSVVLGDVASRDFKNIPDGNYYLTLTAYDDESEMVRSQEIMITTGLTIPTGFSTSVSDSTVSLSWNEVSGASGYKLYYGFSSGDSNNAMNLGEITSREFTNIPDGTYYLTLVAFDADGEGPRSDEIRLTVPQAEGPTLTGDPLAYADAMVPGAWITTSVAPEMPIPSIMASSFICPGGRLKGVETYTFADGSTLEGLAEGRWQVVENPRSGMGEYPAIELDYITTISASFGITDRDDGVLGSPAGNMLYDPQTDHISYLYNSAWFHMSRTIDGDAEGMDDSYCGSRSASSDQCSADYDCGRCWYCDKSGAANTCRYGGEGAYGCYRGWSP
ncbi:MAG: hypothetical protein HN842_06575 [Gammaproteobacteria bacterium]|nr:hypothetical protein [Gammaproteobacteria bacterium]